MGQLNLPQDLPRSTSDAVRVFLPGAFRGPLFRRPSPERKAGVSQSSKRVAPGDSPVEGPLEEPRPPGRPGHAVDRAGTPVGWAALLLGARSTVTEIPTRARPGAKDVTPGNRHPWWARGGVRAPGGQLAPLQAQQPGPRPPQPASSSPAPAASPGLWVELAPPLVHSLPVRTAHPPPRSARGQSPSRGLRLGETAPSPARDRSLAIWPARAPSQLLWSAGGP
ncbi:PREDICTED: skin secretory protein xP2-like [Condylura cristata]|uniref:skin secretory protein xP2-like n=1 Tax=Condylura cristata TaxID=143302 RepID=UPI00033460C9|nr:PREDICTED: skin secretory protein xP2-like [Condylura cristata]